MLFIVNKQEEEGLICRKYNLPSYIEIAAEKKEPNVYQINIQN